MFPDKELIFSSRLSSSSSLIIIVIIIIIIIIIFTIISVCVVTQKCKGSTYRFILNLLQRHGFCVKLI